MQTEAGRASSTHWLYPSSDLAEKEGNSLSFHSLAFVLRLLKSFASWKLEIIPFYMSSAKIPNGLSFLPPVMLFYYPLWLCILSVIKLSLTACWRIWMWACFSHLFVLGAAGDKKRIWLFQPTQSFGSSSWPKIGFSSGSPAITKWEKEGKEGWKVVLRAHWIILYNKNFAKLERSQ